MTVAISEYKTLRRIEAFGSQSITTVRSETRETRIRRVYGSKRRRPSVYRTRRYREKQRIALFASIYEYGLRSGYLSNSNAAVPSDRYGVSVTFENLI